jgi:hypothetical protein
MQPSFADPNTAPAIIGILLRLWVCTSPDHGLPNPVGSRVRCSVLQSAGELYMMTAFMALGYVATSEMAAACRPKSAAVALALPKDVALSAFGRSSTENH